MMDTSDKEMGRWQRLILSVRAVPRNVKLFLVTVLAFGVTVEGIGIVLLNLYLLRLGYGTEFIGTLNSAGLIVFAFVSLPIGAVTRFTGRQMLQLGQVLSLIGLMGLPLAQYVTTGQAALLISFRIVSMIGLSCYFVHQIPFALEITRPVWHRRVMAWSMAAFSMAAFLGSWIGGLLPELFGRWLAIPLTNPEPYQLPMFVAAVILIPSIFTLSRITEPKNDVEIQLEPDQKVSKVSSMFGEWRTVAGLIGLILLIRALQTGGVGIMLTFSNVYLDDALQLPTRYVGLVSGVGRLLGVPLSFALPWLMGRYGNFRLIIVSMVLIVMLMIPIAFIPTWQVAAVGIIAINSMSSLRYLSFVSYTMSLVSDKQRSLISGAGEMAIGTGFAVSSFVGGYLIAWFGYRELFLFGAGMTVIGTVMFWVIFRRRAGYVPPAVVMGSD